MVDDGAGLATRRNGDDRQVPLVAAKLRPPQTAALPRERLDAVLDRLWAQRLALVAAPAGSGKTTLCARFAAAASPTPVAWYRAEAWDGDAGTLLRYLEAALTGAVPELSRGWRSVEDAAAALERWGGERVLLVVDDLHTLRGTAAETELGRLLDYAPPSLVTLLASRAQPDLDLSRLRLGGGLVEVGGDDLRFRLWEIERLFRDVYGEPRPPEELAELARRTDGWAAGLQLFHLATEGRPASERRRLLDGLGPRSRVMRDYLSRNVLDQLPAELRDFLVLTGALGRLTGPLCDALLGATTGRQHLEELERRQVFISAIEEDGSYRYHEVLRAHLEQALVERLGEAGARTHHRRAGEVLEGDGALGDALRAYCRAEAWEAVARLLGREGRQIAGGPVAIEVLPPALLASDPWLALAVARRLRSQGRWADCVVAYAHAETTFRGSEAGGICREERVAVEAWLSADAGRAPDGVALLRSALQENPAGIAAQPAASAASLLATGLAALLAGDPQRARELLVAASELPEAGAELCASAGLAVAAIALAAGVPNATVGLDRATAGAERLGLAWLARLGRALPALRGTPAAAVVAEELALVARRSGDSWGAAVCELFAGWGRVIGGETPVEALEQAAAQLAGLSAGSLEALAAALAALARAGRATVPGAATETRTAAETAVASARALGRRSGCAPALAYTGLAARRLAGGPETDETATLERAGMPRPATQPEAVVPTVAAVPAPAPPDQIQVEARLFGGLHLTLAGIPVDLSSTKPRVRALLRHLLAASGRPVHREVLQEALWPEADTEGGLRNLHVALSSVRQVLERTVPGGAGLVLREGDAYSVVLAADAGCDLRELEQRVAAGRRALAAGDTEVAAAAFTRALELHAGELLPEDGPAEWAVNLRERCRGLAVDAARALAEIRLQSGDAAGAVGACDAGLALDRYADPLWRLLIGAREQGGDLVAAERARQAYREVVEELGLEGAGSALAR